MQRRLCKDSDLIDKLFTRTDVDLTFASIIKPGRKMGFAEFDQAIELAAAKKRVPVTDLAAQIVTAAHKPTSHRRISLVL